MSENGIYAEGRRADRAGESIEERKGEFSRKSGHGEEEREKRGFGDEERN